MPSRVAASRPMATRACSNLTARRLPCARSSPPPASSPGRRSTNRAGVPLEPPASNRRCRPTLPGPPHARPCVLLRCPVLACSPAGRLPRPSPARPGVAPPTAGSACVAALQRRVPLSCSGSPSPHLDGPCTPAGSCADRPSLPRVPCLDAGRPVPARPRLRPTHPGRTRSSASLRPAAPASASLVARVVHDFACGCLPTWGVERKHHGRLPTGPPGKRKVTGRLAKKIWSIEDPKVQTV